MPTRLVHIVADANDPARLARFWAALLGWEIADETADEVDVWPAWLPLSRPGRRADRLRPGPGAQEREEPGPPGPGQQLSRGSGRAGQPGPGPGRRAGGHRPGRRAVGGDGGPGGQRVLRAGAAGHLPRHGPGRRDPHRLRRSRGAGPVLGRGGRLGSRAHRGSALPGCALPRGSGLTWSSSGYPRPRRSRTGSTRTWRPTAARIRPPRWRGCALPGATLADVGQGDDVSWTVLADPEGNEFCVLSPR